jgi:PAS domain S-box-containing protein
VQLTESEYRTLVVYSPMLIWRSGLDARCDYFNEGWLEFTGRTLAEEYGDGWATGVHPEDLQRCFDYYMEHFGRREAFEMEYRLRRHDGVYRWILDRGAPFFDDAGEFAGFIGSCIDIDDRRRAQDERDQRGERALAVAQEFEQWILGIVGHDIRNPLSAIAQAAEFVHAMPDDPATVRRNAERIARGVERIRHLVDDLLDLTRERQGGIPIAKQTANLGALCREVVDELAGTADRRSIELRCGDGDLTGVWDPHRITQAISNLVGNAVVHSPAGTPVTVAITGDAARVTIEVHNHGEIPGELLPTIFNPFQTGKPATRRRGGLGLGLFIASAIARAHGGTIEVASSAAAGTTFWLRLPRG